MHIHRQTKIAIDATNYIVGRFQSVRWKRLANFFYDPETALILVVMQFLFISAAARLVCRGVTRGTRQQVPPFPHDLEQIRAAAAARRQ